MPLHRDSPAIALEWLWLALSDSSGLCLVLGAGELALTSFVPVYCPVISQG